MRRRMFSLLLVLCMVLGMMPVNASADTSCLTVKQDAISTGEIRAGELFSVKFDDVFADTDHTLQYSYESDVTNDQIKIKEGEFFFSAPKGEYSVTLKAKCSSTNTEVSHTIAITVNEGNPGIEEQYNYNETPAESVTVYVTVSSDGYPVFGDGGANMAHLEVTVPYFDLAKYDLEPFYRYRTTDGRGGYTSSEIIERPTGLHLYIYLLERYYMGLEEAECGQGISKDANVLNFNNKDTVLWMNGSPAYNTADDATSSRRKALTYSGSATSLYMTNFWGHDENLMYFRNHCYPYMSPGWGATSDYILLSDGDTWDVAMFTNWEFHHTGYFAKFDQDSYHAAPGESLTLKTEKWGTSAAAGFFADVLGKDGMTVALYDEDWEEIQSITYDSEDSNTLTFTVPEEIGTYYVMALDPNAMNTKTACIAPATAILQVDNECDCEDADGDQICDKCTKDLNRAPVLKDGVQDLTVTVQTGKAYQLDALMNGEIFQDPDGTGLTYKNYFYRKSSDGGKTWSELNGFSEMEHGTVNSTFSNSTPGTYLYEFVAYDGKAYSEEKWTLTLVTSNVITENVTFYLSQDQNYGTHGKYPVLELYTTAGVDENFYDYVGWFTNAAGEKELVYDPHAYTIIDGETDYVEIDGIQYELHDYKKLKFTNSAFDDTETQADPSNKTDARGYNRFYASISTGRYSTRAYGWNETTQAYDVYLGGQSLQLPMEKDIYGNGGNDIYLRVISVYAASKKLDGTYFTADDYTAELNVPVAGSNIHPGTPYVSDNFTYYPFMSWVQGNGCLYNCYVYPTDTQNYIFTQTINNTSGIGITVEAKPMYIRDAYTLTVTVPERGDFKLYLQYNNFNTREQAAEAEPVVNGNGTKTITYKVSKNNSNYTWRLTDPTGTYVTKAGWIDSIADHTNMDISFSEYTNKKTHDFSGLGTAVDDRDEADIQVFLSDTNFKSVSGQTRIRAYRMWELINSDPGNIMFEPDFNIQVLSGNPSDIKLNTGGNALNNWIDVTPTTTDIVAVNYDAIHAMNSDGGYSSSMGGLFPATNPERTNVFIITNQSAGTAEAQIAFNGSKITDRGNQWNYNYDTWFYMDTDEAPKLDFTVTGSGNVTVSYANVITNSSLQSSLSGWNTLTADQTGRYNVSLLPFRNAGTLGGTVIIKMTDSTGTSYSQVRVAEMKATVENLSLPGEPFTPGDEVKVTFDGLYRSVNKISGMFNPTTYYLRYTVDGKEIAGRLQQYWQMDKTELTLTIPEDIAFPDGETSVDYSFTNGYIYGSMYSAASPFSSMYYITDTGVGTNFSAVGTEFVLSRLADIPVTVHMKEFYDLKIDISDGTNMVTGHTITLKNSAGEEMTPDENGIYQDLPFGDYTYDFTGEGYVNQSGTFRLGIEESGNVVDGILTKTFTVVKPNEGAWDGRSATEPAQSNGVYQIGTGAELAWFAQSVNSGNKTISGELTANIDLTSCNWTPIGTTATPFGGSFDGKNFKVFNLLIDKTASSGYGLFGTVQGTTDAHAAIRNLTVEGQISLSASNVGGVVGKGTLLDMNNVHANVVVTSGSENIGGVIGYATGCSITDCFNEAVITGNKSVGGIAGYAAQYSSTPGSVSRCGNEGDISGAEYVSGIAGKNSGSIYADCYNTGSITATGAYAAGIVTNPDGSVTACYNTGSITAAGTYVGGIASRVTSVQAQLLNCFNTGTVTGAGDYVGSIAGTLTKEATVTQNLYYLAGTHTKGFGTCKTGHTVSEVSSETMASADFVITMNTGLETSAFAVGTGCPVLAWQVADPVIPEPEPEPGDDVLYGDVDGDGIRAVSDVNLILKAVGGSVTLTETQRAAANVDGDAIIAVADANYILKLIGGSISKFPCEE